MGYFIVKDGIVINSIKYNPRGIEQGQKQYEKDVDKYAKTKHKGLPNKVKREMKVRNLIKKMVREELANMNEVRIPFSSSHIKQLKRAFKDMKGTLPDNNPLVQQIVTLLKKTDKKVLKQIASADIKYLSDKAKDILGEGTCGYGENGELGEEPAGPHLIKKIKPSNNLAMTTICVGVPDITSPTMVGFASSSP